MHLTPTEFDLLLCLAGDPGTVLTREHLYTEVWGWSGASGTRTVDSHVKALRAKIGADRVRTVHGVGYALEAGALVAAKPLDQVTSVKVKLGLLVAASVLVAALVGALGSVGDVPLWLSIPVTVALALGVTQLLAVGMTSPLREMTAAARRMARGDYSGRVTATSNDEVGELARAFNRMAEDLEAVDQQRRELIASVSHELRTPLAALTAVLENVVDGVGGRTRSPCARRSTRPSGCRRSSRTCSTWPASTPARSPSPRPGSPSGDLLDAASPRRASPVVRCRTTCVVRPADLAVDADPQRLHQLVANLLDNASRHSPAGGRVAVTATAQSSSGWRLEVVDEGPGIPAADRDRVFERFGTLDDGGGTGLGLAIARWVTDLHARLDQVLDPDPGAPRRARARRPSPRHREARR